ncbi:hypothetical protein Tco_0615739, partial [Tanacetum coccineum]
VGNAYDDEDVGAEADLNNLETTLNVSPIPTTRIDKDHPKGQIIGDFNSAIQTRRMTKIFDEHAMTASTPMEPNKALIKDEEANSVDVHLYRSLMYLTAFKPDMTFVVCACARFQVTPKTLHLHAVKRVFRYLKGQPKLGIWYPRDSPFDLELFLIVLWIQNQMLDYGFNFMNTKIYIDNESIICIMKNPVFHSETKHIEIRHHFIRDCYEKKLIQIWMKGQDNPLIPNPHPHLLNSTIKKPIIVPSSCQSKKTRKHRKAIRTIKISQSSGPINLVADETVYKEWEDRMERAATTASSLDAE